MFCRLDHKGKSRPKYDWTLGNKLGLTIPGLCRECFASCYNTTHNLVDACCKEIRPPSNENTNSAPVNADPVFNDRTAIDSEDKQFFKDIEAMVKDKGANLSNEQRAMMLLPNGVKSVDCYQWMHYFFNSYGCKVPNSEEIHLEYVEFKELYEEYHNDVGEERALVYQKFCHLWYVCYPYVKVREFKQCCGKCQICLKLSESRRATRDKDTKTYLSRLFGLHRITFMGERNTYAHRRYLAMANPQLYLSVIADGMAQLHCLLPYFANKYTVNANYKQHIQGIINHGRSLTLYRTFNNLHNGANLAIHCFLLNLEEVIRKEGKLPDTIFVQADGGSENANTTMKGICELLVARGLTKNVILTRLPPGHTHEDIDAVFGKIWKHLQGRAIFTPQGYTRVLREALSKRNIDVNVVDILCIPDYRKFMMAYIDKGLTRCDKEDWAELQWLFKAVDKCEMYPHGVKVQYRKFTADEVLIVYEIKKPNENISEVLTFEEEMWLKADAKARMIGFDFSKVAVKTHPTPSKEGDPDGIYVLKYLPDGKRQFVPQPFNNGSRSELEKLVKKMIKSYGDKFPVVHEEWTAWLEHIAPKSDDANEFVRENPAAMRIPFWNELFSGSPINNEIVVRPHVPKDKAELPPELETTNSVISGIRKSRSILDFFTCVVITS